MTLTLALRTALSGLSATQSALQVTSNNITNVNTEGFSRKQISLNTRVLSGTGAGVDIGRIDRVVDEFLIGQIRDQKGIIGNLDVREEFLSELEALFSSPDNDRSITNGLDGVRDAIEALSVTPESDANRFNTVNELRKLALQINEMSTAAQDLRLKADQEISRTATDITTSLNLISDLNTRPGAEPPERRGTRCARPRALQAERVDGHPHRREFRRVDDHPDEHRQEPDFRCGGRDGEPYFVGTNEPLAFLSFAGRRELSGRHRRHLRRYARYHERYERHHGRGHQRQT